MLDFITFFFYNTIPVSSFLHASKLIKTDNFLIQVHMVPFPTVVLSCLPNVQLWHLFILWRFKIEKAYQYDASVFTQCKFSFEMYVILHYNMLHKCTAHCLENLILVIYWDQWVCWDVLVNSCTVEVENYGKVFVYRITYRLLAVVTLYPTCGLYCMWMVSFSWFMLIFTRF